MRTNLITEAEDTVCTLAELRRQCNITWEDDDTDANLMDYQQVATDLIEDMTGRSICSKVYEQEMCDFPCGRVLLAKSPVISVESVKYYNSIAADAEPVTLDASQYRAIAGTTSVGFIEPVLYWPIPTAFDRSDKVKIRYTAGFATVPSAAKHLVRMIVDYYNESRGELCGKLPDGCSSLLDSLRAGRYY